jgi:MFS family permease
VTRLSGCRELREWWGRHARIQATFPAIRAWYFTGRLISTTGSMMAPIAITFAVLDLTDSASALGGVIAARSIPLIAFMLIGGVVADRFSRSIVMQVSHLLSAATPGMVGGPAASGTAEIWMIIVLEAVNGTVSVFTFPAMFGVVPRVVPRSHIQQANALLGFTRNGLAMIGPSIGAVLVVTVGSGWAVAIDALTWLVVAAGCMAQVKLPAAVTRAAGAAKPTMWRDLVDGWSAFTSYTWVWVVVVAFGLMKAIQAGAWNTLGPVVAKDTIGIPAWGWVPSASAAGYLVMTVVLMQWRLTYPVRAGMIGASLFALPIVMLGYDAHVVPLVLAAFVAGAGMEVFSIGWQTAYDEHIPNEYLSGSRRTTRSGRSSPSRSGRGIRSARRHVRDPRRRHHVRHGVCRDQPAGAALPLRARPSSRSAGERGRIQRKRRRTSE